MARLDKHRRKELLREAKRKEMASAFAALPVDNSELQALFDMLDVRLPVDGCDHSRRLTIEHIRERSLPESSVLQWLCLLYTSPSPRDRTRSRMPSSA